MKPRLLFLLGMLTGLVLSLGLRVDFDTFRTPPGRGYAQCILAKVKPGLTEDGIDLVQQACRTLNHN